MLTYLLGHLDTFALQGKHSMTQEQTASDLDGEADALRVNNYKRKNSKTRISSFIETIIVTKAEG